MRLERAGARTERLGTSATDHAAHHLARASGAPDDLLDGDAVFEQLQDLGVRFGPAAPAFVLAAFRRREQCWIDRACAERLANLAHAPAYGAEERRAGVLEEMPAVGDLPRLGPPKRRRLAVAAPAIPSDDLDRRPRRQPGLDGGGFAVRQHVDDPATLQIADHRAVAMSFPPGPVVDADRFRRAVIGLGAAADRAEQRVLADRDEQAARRGLAGSAAERDAEMMHDVVQSRCPARVGRRRRRIEPFGEDLPRAAGLGAAKPPHPDEQADLPTMRWEVGENALVSAVCRV